MMQYIITEETIGTLERELDCVLMAKDDYAQGYKDAIKSAVKMMRSRPYNPQAEREKVLDEAYTKLRRKMQHGHHTMILDMSDVDKVFEELREGKGE